MKREIEIEIEIEMEIEIEIEGEEEGGGLCEFLHEHNLSRVKASSNYRKTLIYIHTYIYVYCCMIF